MMSLKKAGWHLLAMHDPAKRRGLWYRHFNESRLPGSGAPVPERIEICAGDVEVVITRADLPGIQPGASSSQFWLLGEALSTARWAMELCAESAPLCPDCMDGHLRKNVMHSSEPAVEVDGVWKVKQSWVCENCHGNPEADSTGEEYRRAEGIDGPT